MLYFLILANLLSWLFWLVAYLTPTLFVIQICSVLVSLCLHVQQPGKFFSAIFLGPVSVARNLYSFKCFNTLIQASLGPVVLTDRLWLIFYGTRIFLSREILNLLTGRYEFLFSLLHIFSYFTDYGQNIGNYHFIWIL